MLKSIFLEKTDYSLTNEGYLENNYYIYHIIFYELNNLFRPQFMYTILKV